ncbi:MAG: hypothetical protein ACSHX0_13165 [Akkermansiaceae bacterium]
MKPLLLLLSVMLCLSSCSEHDSKSQPDFSGRVAYIYYKSESGGTKVVTRFDTGIPGTSTSLREDVWVDVYEDWVHVILKNRNDHLTIIPRERVIKIVVETKEGNELNIPK